MTGEDQKLEISGFAMAVVGVVLGLAVGAILVGFGVHL